MIASELHNKLKSLFSQVEGSKDFKEIFDNPNHYGDVVSTFFFKHGFWKKGSGSGHSRSEIKYTHKTNTLFIPCNGYFVIDNPTPKKIFEKSKKTLKF